MSTLDDWTEAVCAELGIGDVVDRDAVLDLTRVVAHGVARPAAPLTAYLVGLAAGRQADPAAATRQIADRVAGLARAFPSAAAD